jgi:hypothetical protein
MRCCRARLSVVGVTGARFGWVGNPFKTVGVTLYFYLFIAVYYEWCCVNCWSPFGHLFIILPSFLGLRVARLSRTQISRRHQSSFSLSFLGTLVLPTGVSFCYLCGSPARPCLQRAVTGFFVCLQMQFQCDSANIHVHVGLRDSGTALQQSSV